MNTLQAKYSDYATAITGLQTLDNFYIQSKKEAEKVAKMPDGSTEEKTAKKAA